ncbi:cyclopropane-fatty-acyl-phospholipid synthase family protein [Patulibacter sp. NPDC049589]|uniref:cyclopropane-fatty-acyl-phospholipid synthase family protein n=1 Tax=Patulibacter sp. NPDC049589 TaxID=3154731 RepID=UPI003419B303
MSTRSTRPNPTTGPRRRGSNGASPTRPGARAPRPRAGEVEASAAETSIPVPGSVAGARTRTAGGPGVRRRRGPDRVAPAGAGAADLLRPIVDRVLGRLGKPLPLHVRFWDGSVLAAGDPAAPTVVVRAPEALAHALRNTGELGIARAWVLGLADLEGDVEDAITRGQELRGLRITARDKAAVLRAAIRLGAVRPAPLPEAEATVRGHRHDPESDSAAVQYHYDISNHFYRLVLGPSMVYSCAYFEGPEGEDDDLEAAQARKLDLICRKLRLHEGERLLDVGCGWGSLVIHAARRYGVHAVGITASPAQADLAQARVREAGLEDRVEIRVQDYRDVDDGPFDAIASVGMYEHVGEAQLPTYAAKLFGLLRPGGRLLNHGITRLHDGEQRQETFTDRYVFPDGELHRLAVVVDVLEQAGLEVRDVESLREHYARTLRAWSRNLATHRDEAVADVGFQRERVWRLYMAASAAVFASGHISIVQTLAVKPGAPHELPPTRAHHLDARP